METEILVKCIPKITTQNKLKSLFTIYGAITGIKILEGKRSQYYKAIITFKKKIEAEAAIKQLNGYKLDGSILGIKLYEKEDAEKNKNSNPNITLDEETVVTESFGSNLHPRKKLKNNSYYWVTNSESSQAPNDSPQIDSQKIPLPIKHIFNSSSGDTQKKRTLLLYDSSPSSLKFASPYNENKHGKNSDTELFRKSSSPLFFNEDFNDSDQSEIILKLQIELETLRNQLKENDKLITTLRKALSFCEKRYRDRNVSLNN